MHIILAILGALATGFWLFTRFMSVAKHGREALGEVKGVIRRGNWSRRVDQGLIENLSDPREAAAIMMVQIASYDGALTDIQKTQIIADMREHFEADAETAEGLYAFGRMAVGEINDAGNSVRKILRPVVEVCTPDEKQNLIDMLERAAESEGAPTDIQRRLITEARRVLLED
ncbi:MAG: TerB family tellurite resistance protein [Marinicaulis sp.]|nr:TerB family tellurite resistance protein [Marinicaulis sp.]